MIKMVRDVEVVIALFFLLMGVIVIFNARWIVKNKFNDRSENIAVTIVKVLGYLLCVAALVFIYYMRKIS